MFLSLSVVRKEFGNKRGSVGTSSASLTDLIIESVEVWINGEFRIYK